MATKTRPYLNLVKYRLASQIHVCRRWWKVESGSEDESGAKIGERARSATFSHVSGSSRVEEKRRRGETPVEVEIEGRTVRLSNLDKTLYPSGFTKAEVVDYHARIAPWIIPHLTGRCLTFRRYPDGTDQDGFFEKRCPSHRPEWVPVALGIW